PGVGPLVGLVAAMAYAQRTLVLVLAVDLPRMSGEYLRELLPSAPIVLRRGDRFEPLAAVYSKRCVEVLQRRLIQRRLSLQSAIHELVENGDLRVSDVPASDASLFDNLNTPEDLAFFVQARSDGT